MSLEEYRKKRNFEATTEPEGGIENPSGKLQFVVQRHAATHLHYDFRLEFGGVLKSWAIPKGPSMDPADRRLAVHVEDHPVSYGSFEGEIPKGNYGAGMVEIWDKGWYEPDEIPENADHDQWMQQQLTSGSIKIILHGEKLKGGFALVKIKGKDDEDNWLLIKHKDEFVIPDYSAEDFTDVDSLVTQYLNEKKNKKNKKSATKSTENPPLKAYRNFAPAFSGATKLKEFIKPMLASTAEKPFDSDEWIFEIKWDGYRAIADLRKDVQLYSRNGLPYRNGFFNIISELRQQEHQMVLDGEIVAYDKSGKPSFQSLQNVGNSEVSLKYQVFDLLWLNGHSTENLTLLERKELLKEALVETRHIQFHDHVENEGKAFFEQIKSMDLEGMIAKKKSSVYVRGTRSENWLKIKNHLTDEVFICGYTAPKGERPFFGSLIAGCEENGKLLFCGHVGTGFDDATLQFLYETMQPYVQKTCPFEEIPATNDVPTWLKPVLIAEIKHAGKTKDQIFRHPVYMGLRKDLMEENLPQPKVQTKKAGNIPFPISNPEKVYFPESGITKMQIAEYYYSISEYILPHLQNRPQSMNRFPDGITGMNFYQKDAPEHAMDDVLTTRIYSDSTSRYIDYIICNDARTMSYMNNLGCIDFNVWPSTVFRLDHPDYLMLDLDPSEKNSFDDVREVSLAIKSVLDKLQITGYCKTSGSRGMHIFIPLNGKYDYEQTKNFAHLLMQQVQQLLPDLTTLERSLKKRSKSKIYLDYLQNRRGQTLASVYSVRPKAGATVSMPLEWHELEKPLHPAEFNLLNAAERIKVKGDLFKPVLGKGIDMLHAMEILTSK